MEKEIGQRVREAIVIVLKSVVGEINDSVTRKAVRGTLGRMVEVIPGVFSPNVVCDETNNPPDAINKKQLWVKVFAEDTPAETPCVYYWIVRIEPFGHGLLGYRIVETMEHNQEVVLDQFEGAPL